MLTDDALHSLFHTLYFKELSSGDEFVQSLWRRIFPTTSQMLRTIGLDECVAVGAGESGDGKLKRSEIARLENVIHETVPELRRETAPLRAGDDRKEEKETWCVC